MRTRFWAGRLLLALALTLAVTIGMVAAPVAAVTTAYTVVTKTGSCAIGAWTIREQVRYRDYDNGSMYVEAITYIVQAYGEAWTMNGYQSTETYGIYARWPNWRGYSDPDGYTTTSFNNPYSGKIFSQAQHPWFQSKIWFDSGPICTLPRINEY